MSPRLHAMRLINMLERSNYINIRHLSPMNPNDAIPTLLAAKMVCYYQKPGKRKKNELRSGDIWVPDIGTYDWIVETKPKLYATPGAAKP